MRLAKKLVPHKVKKDEIDRIKKILINRVKPLRLILFGSALSDQFCDQSDIDFLIVVNSSQEIKEKTRKLRAYQPMSQWPVDLVWMQWSEFEKKKNLGGVAMIAHEDGVVLFDRSLA